MAERWRGGSLRGGVAIAACSVSSVLLVQADEQQDTEPNDDSESDRLERHCAYPLFVRDKAAHDGVALALKSYRKKEALLGLSILNRSDQTIFMTVTFSPREPCHETA